MNALEELRGPLVPDALGKVDAWRAWRVQLVKVPGGKPALHLVALHSERVWVPSATQALACRQAGCPATSVRAALESGIDCRCGYHGWGDPHKMREYMQVELTDRDIAVVGGRVHLWGSVCEHKKGWRAEHAQAGEITAMLWNKKLRSLENAPLRAQVLTELAARYEGLDVLHAVKKIEDDAQRERERLVKIDAAPWHTHQLRRLRERCMLFQFVFMALLIPPAFLHGHLLKTDGLTAPIQIALLASVTVLAALFLFCSFHVMRQLHRATRSEQV